MRILRLLIFCFLLMQCRDNEAPESKEKTNSNNSLYSDSVWIVTTIKDNFSKSERVTQDSIEKYKLDSLYNDCLSMLYSVYGPNKFNKRNTNQEITLGECDLRATEFKYLTNSKRRIVFTFFASDSLPIEYLPINRDFNSIIYAFELDIIRKKIIDAITDSDGKISYTDMVKIKEAGINNTFFKEYKKTYKERLHVKFKKLL